MDDLTQETKQAQDEKPAPDPGDGSSQNPERSQEPQAQEEGQDVQLPDWLFAPPPPMPPPVPPSMPPPAPPPVPPQYQPPMYAQQHEQYNPQIPIEELVQRPRDVIRREAREEAMNSLLPVVNRLMEIDYFTRQQHVENLRRLDLQARAAIGLGYKEVAKDPAFKDNNVRAVFDTLLASYLEKARYEAAGGNMGALHQFQNPRFIRAALELAKVHTGYVPPDYVSVRGGETESSRSMPSVPETKLSEDEEIAAAELARATGRSIEDVRKRMLASLDQRRKERWS